MTTLQRGLILAGGAAVLAGGALVAATWRALTVEPVPGDPAVHVDAAAPPPGAAGGVDPAVLTLVAEHDPFRPERAPAPLPYRMPGDPVEEEVEAYVPPPPDPPPPFLVLGTIAMEDGGLILIRTEESPVPQVLRVGQSIQGFRLTRVGQKTAVLERGDQVVQLAVADPSQAAAQPEEERDDRRRRGRSEEEQQAEALRQRAEEQAARLRALLQQRQTEMRARGGGGGGGGGGEIIEFVPLAPTAAAGRSFAPVRPVPLRPRPDTMTTVPSSEHGP